MTACITGWSHLTFGKKEEDVEDMIVKVAVGALEDAGLSPDQIDAIYIGNFNGGFNRQEFPSSLVMQADPRFRFTPATRVENACATGSAAIYQGLSAIRAGQARRVLVVGVEKMTEVSGKEVGDILIKASYLKQEGDIDAGFAGVFGRIAQQYFQRHGDQSEALALIASKNHKNGCDNELAHMRKDFDYEFCLNPSDKNPFVAGPLKRTDCSLVSDGAAAMVLTDVDTALSAKKAIVFRAAQHVNDFLPLSKRDIIKFEGCAMAWQKAHQQAGTSINDLSFVETHDCFTIAELLEYEAMGLTAEGRGADAIKDGITTKDGKLPINRSGGLKSKGHPIGATGVSMHVMAAMQLAGEAGAMQLKDPKLGGVFNMGGAAVANYVSILERLR